MRLAYSRANNFKWLRLILSNSGVCINPAAIAMKLSDLDKGEPTEYLVQNDGYVYVFKRRINPTVAVKEIQLRNSAGTPIAMGGIAFIFATNNVSGSTGESRLFFVQRSNEFTYAYIIDANNTFITEGALLNIAGAHIPQSQLKTVEPDGQGNIIVRQPDNYFYKFKILNQLNIRSYEEHF